MCGDPLQQGEGQGRLAFCQQVDLQFKVIAALEGPVGGILPDQDAGSQKDGLKRERQQQKRVLVKAPAGSRGGSVLTHSHSPTP